MVLESTKSHLSPVIDLSSASIKTISNRIENPKGTENRYGRRNQIIKFYPVYQLELTGNAGTEIFDNQTIVGQTSKTTGTIARVVGNVVYVRVKTSQFFQKGELVSLGSQETLTNVSVDSNPVQVFFDIADSATIVARNPSVLLETYDNIITGKSVVWNSQNQELTLRTDTRPINDDYTGRIIDNVLFNRNAETGAQISDIFRVGDFIKYPNQDEEENSDRSETLYFKS